jgi:hypothetical protein
MKGGNGLGLLVEINREVLRLKFGDISIKGTAKEQQMKLQRQQFARRAAEAAIAVAEIEAARFARLPSLGYWRRTRLRPPTAAHLGAGLREERSWAILDAFFNLFRCG